MKIFEIFQELPKCDTETQSEKMLFKPAQHRVATKLQFVLKKKKSVKPDKVKYNKRDMPI